MQINPGKLLQVIFSESNLSWGAYGLLCTLILTRDLHAQIDVDLLKKICPADSVEIIQECLNELKNEGWIV